MIMKRYFSTALLCLAGLSSAPAQTNVIFVTIDDLSRESLGIHGCSIPTITPNIDALGYSRTAL